MTVPKFNFIDYLAAKKSVDDRALNQNVLQSLRAHLPKNDLASPLQVVEIAAGIGTMLERLVDWGVITTATYTAIDIEPSYIAEAAHRLPRWANDQGFTVEYEADHIFVLRRNQGQADEQQIRVILETSDVFDFVLREQGTRQWDLLIGHAFLDLVAVPHLFSDLFSLLKPNGLFYFSINFDGETIFLPAIEPDLDDKIISTFHGLMDAFRVNGRPVGGSRTGRQLFQHLQAAGTQIIAAGSSDWVVYPGPTGYPADEALFLHCIIDTIHEAVQGEFGGELQAWIAKRHAQIEQHQLIYIAHQLDFLGKVGSGAG